jgi:hypothetical protein
MSHPVGGVVGKSGPIGAAIAASVTTTGKGGPDGGARGAPTSALVERIRSGIIGDDEVMDTPYGRLRVTYADYTASGRAVDFLEDFIGSEVLPRYANTHTESSGTGRQTSRLREDARAVVHDAVGGDDTLVIFTGSGATGAIDKMIAILGLRIPSALDDRFALSSHIPREQRPVVFIGPFEHHSNELPWRESLADLVVVPADADGHIDLQHLDRELDRYADRPRIGSFPRPRTSPASSPTPSASRRFCTHTARCPSGTTRPLLRTCPSRWVALRAAAPTRMRCSFRRTSSWAAQERLACWSFAGSWSSTVCPRSPAAERSPT